MLRLLGALVALAILGVGLWQYQQSYCQLRKAENQAEQASKSDSNSKPFDCAADKLCAAISQADASAAQPKGKPEKEGTEYFPAYCGVRLKITDALLALFTLLLVIIGWRQAVRLKQTIESSIHSERAYLYPADFKAQFMPTGANTLYYETISHGDRTKAGVALPWGEFTIGNLGRTAAIIKSIRSEVFFGEDLPRKRKFTYSARATTDEPLLPEKSFAIQKSEWNRHLTTDEWKAAKDHGYGKGPYFFIFGEIEYEDVFGHAHARGFGMKFMLRTPYVWGGKQYNYDKSRKRIASPDAD